jgi:hypothetical protein
MTLPWADVPRLIVERSNEVDRFRPGYWMMRIPEVALWGTNAWGWYLDRLLLIVATMVGAYALARRHVGVVLAGLASVLVVVGPQAEAWFRLGPQEAFATPFLLWGLVFIAWRRPWIGIALVLAAAATKESFVPFALAAILSAWWGGAHRPAAVGAVIGALILGAALAVNGRAGLYAQSRSVADLAETADWMLRTTARVTLWPVLAAISLFVGWRPSARLALVGAALFGAEAYFYAGVTAGRYLIPVILLAVSVSIVALGCLEVRRPTMYRLGVAALVVVVVLNLSLAWSDSRVWERRARAWQAGIEDVRALMASQPDAVLEVVPRSVDDYERVLSLRRFIPQGKAMLAPVPLPQDGTALDARLAQVLRDTSAGNGFPGYEAWSAEGRRCIAITFSKRAPTRCGSVVVIRNS